MGGKIDEIGASWGVPSHALITRAKLKLADGLKATVEHRAAARAVAVTLAGKKWEVGHDFGKKDTRFKYKAKAGGADVTIKQFVPGGKWALFPNPVIEVSKGGLWGADGKLSASYDFMERVAAAEQKLFAGEDRRHKAWVKLHSKKGPSAGLRSKLRAGPLLHSAAASYAQRGGVELSVKSKWEDIKVKSSYEWDADVLKVAAKLSPAPLSEGGAEAALTLQIVQPVRSKGDPRITLGVKWDL